MPSPDEKSKSTRSHGDLLPCLASWVAGVLCALNVLFLVGLLYFAISMATASKPAILLGVPPLLTTLFVLALVSAFLTIGSLVGSILAWWGRFWSVGRRVHYTLVALAALAFACELLYWNLLGFHV